MTREVEKAIKMLEEIIDEGWLISDLEKCPAIDACEMAIESLKQEPCEDAISRQAVIEYIEGSEAELGHSSENELVCQYIKELPPVNPQPKTGRWILAQRDKCVDISCSECGNTRLKEYAHTIDELNLDEINNLIAKIRMNYCECCGTKMQGVQK